MGYGPQAPMHTTILQWLYVATAVQRRWACHTRTVLPTDAYGRQRCNVVLSACSVVYLWCMSWAVCSLERATKTDKMLPLRTYKVGRIQRNPGNRLIHSRKKKTLSARHAIYSARIELKPRPHVLDGLPVSCLLYTSPSPRDQRGSRMPSSA